MAKQNKFGTFGGVFVPSILTILGVIMYLRLPMIVGEAGLWATIGIIVVAHIISITTGLSVSSIATDKKVEAGGTYFMISRSLGLPIGGTLGLALFVGLSFSVSLYLIGFSESFLNYWGFSTDINSIRITGSIVLLAVTTLTFISTSLAIKTQYFIMAAIGLSLLSIFLGTGHDYTPSVPTFSNPSSTIPLMVLFGIFFPAVTGFEAGVSMSGDLKDAKKSIPTGSIMAIAVGFVVYIVLAFFFSYSVDKDALINDPRVLLNISLVPELVIAGIWGATLSSALGSILGAPRILQATAVDRITPKFFAKGFGPTNEPRNALILTFFIAEAGILIGELNVIARVVSIFFITTYGFLNISATFERWTSADFRPEFKIPGWISIIGALACILVMIQLDFIAMLGAITILGLLFLYLKRKELSLESGDAWSSVWASLVKTGLTNLKRDKLHKRNWRPNILLFSGDPNSRGHLVELGKAISGKLGILSAFEIIERENSKIIKTASDLTENENDESYFFHKVYFEDVYSGIDQISRVYGFSGVEPNTILMGWSKNPRAKDKFIELLQSFDQNHFNSIFLNYNKDRKFGNHHQIDIWWSGAGRNLGLAINLMRYITNSLVWKRAKVRVLIINPINEDEEIIHKAIEVILTNFRVDAAIKIINNEIDAIEENAIVAAESGEADLAIIGIPDQKYRHLDRYYDQISGILESCGTALVINASDNFEEMEVISPVKPKREATDLAEDVEPGTLPPIGNSKHPEVAIEIQNIFANGQNVLDSFNKKTFLPIIKQRAALLKELEEIIKYTQKELINIEGLKASYLQKKKIDKIKNDVFYKINTSLNQGMIEKIIPSQTLNLSDGIQWFKEILKNFQKNHPSKLKIIFEKDDFAANQNDPFSLNIYKRIKRFNSRLTGHPIKHAVNYKRVSKYYLLSNRLVSLDKHLIRFNDLETTFYENLRKIINGLTRSLDQAENRIWNGLANWNNKTELDEVSEKITIELSTQSKLLKSQESKLITEFRKNLYLMSNDLSKVNVDWTIAKKIRSPQFYKRIDLNSNSYAEERQLKIKTLLNLILMELSVNATKNRIEALQIQIGDTLETLVEQKYLKQLENLVLTIETGIDKVDLQKLKFDDSFEADLQDTFDNNIERMIGLVEEMPETLEVYSFNGGDNEDQETLSIPVARMATYYLKSRYQSVVEERFIQVLDYLKRSIYSSKDLLNLTQFNLINNINEDNPEEKKELLELFATKLENEIAHVRELIEEFKDFSADQLKSSFEPLASVKIEESSKDFSMGLRTFQGKKALSLLIRIRNASLMVVQNLTTKLFYSRSEGILFAKKLAKPGTKSLNSRLLDLKESVSPSKEILDVLPTYYTTLFSGKSNIGQDFWIRRMIEEKTFVKAVKRYRQGFGGGVMVIGDRNSGKTVFCRQVALQHLKTHEIYSVFPPVQGTSSIEGFSQSVSKATLLSGDVNQIFSQLKEGSVIILNDLELFWERSSEGLEVVLLLQNLIDQFGQKVLFIVNMNPYSFKLINQLTRLEDQFIEIIDLTAFDAEELKDLIMKRHRSSGLSISFNSFDNNLNELQVARLSNSYFDYSNGNPGTALNGWLSNIRKYSKNGLIVDMPDVPALACLKELNEDWAMLLVQFILHKRLTVDKIKRVTNWDELQIKSLVMAMLRSGIIQEKVSGIYHVNPYILPFLVKVLKETEVLK